MNQLQEEIYKTVDIIVQNRLKDLKFDKTKKGRVISVDNENCMVLIDGEEYNCKIKKGLCVVINDIVLVTFPLNNSVSKYVVEVVSGNGAYAFFKMLGAENKGSIILDCGLPDSLYNGTTLDGGGV